jgi:hypothetical protein
MPRQLLTILLPAQRAQEKILSTFERYRRNVYSQNGEDGVIAEIIRRIGLKPTWTCDVGAWDGRYGSNCYALVKKGWPCLMIEADGRKFEYLQQLARRADGLIRPMHAHVDHAGGPQSLDALIERATLPGKIEVLSIDIDSYDYFVWQSLSHRPAIVVIEITSSTPPGEHYIFGSDRGSKRLTTFSAMLELGRRKQYTLACHTGNMIFVREEDAPRLGLSAEELAHPESLFVTDWMQPTRAQVLKRKLKFMTPQRAWVKCVNAIHGNGPA